MTEVAAISNRIAHGRLVGAEFLRGDAVRSVFEVLNRDGDEGRIVGGAVRDFLIGEPVREVDFATTALPDVVAARAKSVGLGVAPTGVDHGTVTLIVGGAPFEATTLREDVATDGRRATVLFGRSFERDAERRDFTMNALSVAADGRLFDYVGGLDDLRARRVRFIGDPATRIREDYLRSLRFLRFEARFGSGAPDPAALAAIVTLRDGLEGLSRERVRSELMKLLVAPGAAAMMRLMSGMGLVASLLGGVAYCDRLAAVADIERALGRPPDAELRLAAATLAVTEDADRLRERLRLSNAERDRLRAAARLLAQLHGRDDAPRSGELLALLFRFGRRACLDALCLAAAEAGAANRAGWLEALAAVPTMHAPSPPFGGADVMARGVESGAVVGAVLKDLQARWIRAGFPREAAAIARLLDDSLAHVRVASAVRDDT